MTVPPAICWVSWIIRSVLRINGFSRRVWLLGRPNQLLDDRNDVAFPREVAILRITPHENDMVCLRHDQFHYGDGDFQGGEDLTLPRRKIPVG